MGDFEVGIPVSMESTLKYHPGYAGFLTQAATPPGTLSGGQFDWGGRLPKRNGGVLRFPQAVWKSAVEHKGIRELDCETDRSSRCESRP